MTRASWNATRARILDAQRGQCHVCRCVLLTRWDVARAGALRAFCRPCRVRYQAPAAQRKAAATRARGRMQMWFWGRAA